MIRISLPEWGRSEGLVLDDDELAGLLGSDAVSVRPSLHERHRWVVNAKQFVGVAQFGQLELRIMPKVGVHRLMELLAPSQDRIQWDPSVSPLQEHSDDLISVISAAFAARCTELLHQGLLHGYRGVTDALPAVRGRIETSVQVARRSGLALPVELSFDEFTPDVVENQLLAGALRQLLRSAELPLAIRNQLRRLELQLVGVAPIRPSRNPPSVSFTRLNDRYRPAVELARLILRASSLDERTGTTAGVGFLIDMNRVFEDVVGDGICRALDPRVFAVDLQREHRLDDDGRLKIRPDVICRSADRQVVAVADVKYKQPDLREVSPQDVYQVLTYVHRFGLDEVHLVYASPPPFDRLRVGGVEVVLSWIDLSRPGQERDTQLRSLADALVGRSCVELAAASS